MGLVVYVRVSHGNQSSGDLMLVISDRLCFKSLVVEVSNDEVIEF